MVTDDCLVLPPAWGATVPSHPRSHRPISPSQIPFSPPPLPPVAHEKQTSSVSPEKSNDSSSEDSRPGRLVIRLPIKGVKKTSTSTSSSSSDQEKRPLAEEKSSEEKSAIKEEKLKKRCRFSLELTREEIDKDLLAITGKEPSSRPRKRKVERDNQRDSHAFPGLSLSFISKFR